MGDVTTQREAECPTREHDSLFRDALEASDVGAWEVDLVTNRIISSPAMVRLIGFEPSNLDEFWSMVHPDDVARVKATTGAAVAPGLVFDHEFRVTLRSGEVRWIHTKGRSIVRNGKATRIVGISRDITQEKLKQDEYEELLLLANYTAQATQDAVYFWNLETDRVRWAQPGRDFFKELGYDPPTIPDIVDWWSERIHPDDRSRVFATLDEAVRTRASRWNAEYRFKRADGSYAYIVERGYISYRSTGGGPLVVGSMQDFSERKRIDESLEKSEEALRLALRASQIGFFNWDLRKDTLYLDPLIQKDWGLGDLQIKTFDDALALFHVDDVGHIKRALDHSIATREPFTFESRLKRPIDGKPAWVEIKGEAQADSKGQVVRIIGTCLNITERKLNEQKLRENEAWFRTVTEALPQIIWTTRPDGLQEYANRRWFEYTGAELALTIGENWKKLVHPDDRERVARAWSESVRTGKPFETEYRFKHRSGSYHWNLVRALPIRNEEGEILHWLGTNTDIHDQKEAIEQMARSEAKLLAVLRQLPVGVVLTDAKERVVATNEAHRLIWSSKGTEEINDYFNLDLRWYESGVRMKREDSTVHRALQEKRPVLNDLIRIHNFADEEKIILIAATPIYLSSGELVGGVAVVQDVTEQKKIEAEMTKAKEEAERANQMKSAFLANMSHEIRTPLGAILGFTEILKDPSIDEGEKKLALDVISRNGEQVTAIINDVLDLSKIEAGLITVETIQTSPRSILSDAANVMRAKARDKGISLNLDIDASVPETIGTDPVRLRQIVSNVVSNAVKFTQSGSVQIKARYANEYPHPRLIVDVQDTGIGISDEQKGRIFKNFSQADESMTRKFGGTGLGLVLSRSLAKVLGGELNLVSSQVGEGSCFRIEIEDRLAAAPHEPVAKKVSPEMGSTDRALAGMKVLLVEDSPDNQLLITRILNKRKTDITLANNGLEGVEKALDGNFDLVLMDLQMPIMDGYSAIQKLRENGFQKPIIALSAHAMLEVRHKCLMVGCTDFLAKPINSRDLVEKVARYAQ